MFRKKRAGGLTFIAQGTKLTGDSQFSGETLIAGELYGDIRSSGNINIEADGLVDGQLNCVEMRVSGVFKGKLKCEKLIITGTGTVDAEVGCQSMEIYEGGQFIGMRVRDDVAFLPSSSNTNKTIDNDSHQVIEDAELGMS